MSRANPSNRAEQTGDRGGRGRSAWKRSLSALMCAAIMLCATPSLSVADEYDDNGAGHPLRIIAYVLHPVGVALDYLLLRPAHWLVSQEPMKTVFGHED